jgi:hypothetical protein
LSESRPPDNPRIPRPKRGAEYHGRGTEHQSPTQSNRNGAILWGGIALLVVGAMGLIWLLSCSKSASPVTAVPTRTPRPTFTAVGPAVQPSSTAVLSPATLTPVPPTAIPAEPSATPVPPTPLPPTSVAPTTPTATPLPPVPAAKPLQMNSPEYGMQAFLWWRPEVASRDMGVILDAGFGWVKQNISWNLIEGAGKGKYDWSRLDWIVYECNKRGLDLLVRVDCAPTWAGGTQNCVAPHTPPRNYADYGDFVYAVATRYKGRIRAYEIWNEPNLASEWGGQPPNPGRYVELLKVAYRRLKEADPNAMVVSAGLAPTTASGAIAMPDMDFLRQMYAAGAKSYFDALGAHGAGYKAPPEMSPDDVAYDSRYNHNEPGVGRIYCFRHVEDLRQIMVDKGDSAKQVIILEFGWTIDPRPTSDYYWHSLLDDQLQADYFVRAYQWAKAHWSPWIGLMSLIYIADPDWTEANEQYWWAISLPGYPDFKPRPAYLKLKAIAK